MDTLIGKVIDNYKILEVLGKGGMGVVLKAMDTTLDRVVALKMMDPALSRDESFLKRFRSEAKALAKLENPNIVNIFALRETEAGLLIVMEYVNAETLADKIQQSGPIQWQKALPLFKQLLNGIGHAHQTGVIHRDIKPRNVLLTDEGIVKIMDFGLAKLQQASDVTVTQAMGGTLHYMSPEQVKGLANVDQRSDLYSLGMTFYEILVGRTPFEKGGSDYTVLDAIVKKPLPPPTQFNPAVPTPLVNIIMKSLEKDPADRYQTAEEMLHDIERFEYAEGNPDRSRELSPPPPKKNNDRPPAKKSGMRMVFIPAIVVVVLVILLFAIPGIREDLLGVFEISSSKEMNGHSGTPDNSGGEPEKLPSTDNNSEKAPIAGVLEITSNPSGAIVRINGERAGTTPYRDTQIRTGNYRVQLELNGYHHWEQRDVAIKAGEIHNIDANLEAVKAPAMTASLFLKAFPDGVISVDGKTVQGSASNGINLKLAPGRHTVMFQHDGTHTKEISVEVKSGKTERYTCYFTGYLNVISLDETGQPLWSSVVIDGKENDDLTTPIDKYPLPAGSHTIMVKRNGYRPVEGEQQITVEPAFSEKVIRLVFHLEKE